MTNKPRILVVGSFVMDVIATTERVPHSAQTVYGKAFHMAPGGKGANQALQCARLGADVTMVGCVGNDLFGHELLETPRKAGAPSPYSPKVSIGTASLSATPPLPPSLPPAPCLSLPASPPAWAT